MKALLTSLIMLVTFGVNAQTIDLNKKDITKMKNFDGSKVSFFGFKPGMSRAEAVKKLKALKQFTYRFDEITAPSKDVNSMKEMMIEVSMKAGYNMGGRNPQIMKLIWYNGAKSLSEMQLHEIAYDFLKGDTKKLTVFSEVDLNGDLMLNFLDGKPEEKVSNGFIDHNYPAQHFMYTYTPFDEAAGGRSIILSFFNK